MTLMFFVRTEKAVRLHQSVCEGKKMLLLENKKKNFSFLFEFCLLIRTFVACKWNRPQ